MRREDVIERSAVMTLLQLAQRCTDDDDAFPDHGDVIGNAFDFIEQMR